ncbi:MAG: dihydroneopterin aldolase [Myxococcota bacterium]
MIRIQELRVQCVVGIHPHERQYPQPLIVDLDLEVPTETSGADEDILDTVDYSSIQAEVLFLLEGARFHLLETAVHVLAKLLLAPPPPSVCHASVDRVHIQIRKPHALGGNGIASVEIERDRNWAQLERELKPFGTKDILHKSPRVEIYLLHVGPEKQTLPHSHRTMSGSEMVLTDGLLCQGTPMPRLFRRSWHKDVPPVYENPTSEIQTVLGIDIPSSIDEDER